MIAAALGFVLRHEALVGWSAVLAGAALLGGLAAHGWRRPASPQRRRRSR